jgi:DNA processing protein
MWEIQQVTLEDEVYPLLVRSYAKAPQVLYCIGDMSLLNTPLVAVVGTRNPTPLGRKIAASIAAFFAQEGYVVVSGLALGCDTAAHQGALSVGGRTLAVLGSSLHAVYPPENRGLARTIVERGGLLVTAYATDEYVPGHFVERDHLQAALSLAVIPVQAGKKSGTLHTCRSALSQGRWVFVPVPVPRDEQKYPDRYVGIRKLMGQGECVAFAGKQDYPALLELLLHTPALAAGEEVL